MGDDFIGVIIGESLSDKLILNKVRIISTRVEKTTERHRTPWLKQWTLHTVEVPESIAPDMAGEISKSLDYSHGTSWYADFKNSRKHFIIFKGRIFCIDRKSREQYEEARKYGLSLGIPPYQVDFHP